VDEHDGGKIPVQGPPACDETYTTDF